jgi:hypothetical protein
MCRERVNKLKTVRIALCTFRTTTSSPDARPRGIHPEVFSNHHLCESHRAKEDKSGGSDPTFWRSIRPKVLSGSLLAVKFSSSGEVGFTPLLHRNLTCYFTLDRARHYGNQSDESSRRTKLRAPQTAPEAGATPPFDARCVTVAVESLPPSQETSGPRFARLHAQTGEFVRQEV